MAKYLDDNGLSYLWQKIKAHVNTAISAIGKVPTGGTAGQILAKASGTDYDTEWVTNSGAGNYLPISGGTLTGQLEIPDSAVADASQTPSANQYGSALYVTDQQGVRAGYLGLIHETNDNLWTQLGVTRDVSGSPAYNSLWLGLADDGTPAVYLGGSAVQQAWQKALNVLPLSGGEMTGLISRKGSTLDLTAADNGLSSPWNPVAFSIKDGNDLYMGHLQWYAHTSGYTAVMLDARNDGTGSDVTNQLSLRVNNDGTRQVTVSEAAPWRTAIGVSYSNATSLYDNSSGTTGTVTLSQSAANFNILEIFFCDIDGNCSSVHVWSPNGKVVSLTTSAVVGTNLFFVSWTRRVKINGTSIANQMVSSYSTGRFYIYATGSTGVQSDNYIKIIKVLGWKG